MVAIQKRLRHGWDCCDTVMVILAALCFVAAIVCTFTVLPHCLRKSPSEGYYERRPSPYYGQWFSYEGGRYDYYDSKGDTYEEKYSDEIDLNEESSESWDSSHSSSSSSEEYDYDDYSVYWDDDVEKAECYITVIKQTDNVPCDHGPTGEWCEAGRFNETEEGFMEGPATRKRRPPGGKMHGKGDGTESRHPGGDRHSGREEGRRSEESREGTEHSRESGPETERWEAGRHGGEHSREPKDDSKMESREEGREAHGSKNPSSRYEMSGEEDKRMPPSRGDGPYSPCGYVGVYYQKGDGEKQTGTMYYDVDQEDNFPDCFYSSCEPEYEYNEEVVKEFYDPLEQAMKEETVVTCYYYSSRPNVLYLEEPEPFYWYRSAGFHSIFWPALVCLVLIVVIIIRKLVFIAKHKDNGNNGNAVAPPPPAYTPNLYVIMEGNDGVALEKKSQILDGPVVEAVATAPMHMVQHDKAVEAALPQIVA